MIKIFGLLKSFAFVMWCICGAFFQEGIDQADKRLFWPCRVSKMQKGFILVNKLGCMDIIKILGLLRSFTFVMRCNCRASFIEGTPNLIRTYSSHTGCPKNAKWPHFSEKIAMYGYDKNIGSFEKFYLCDAVHLLFLFFKKAYPI